MTHFKTNCRGCGVLLAQCRCPSPDKTQQWSECASYPNCATTPALLAAQRSQLTAERDALKLSLELREIQVAALKAEFEAYQLTAVEQFGLLQNERNALRAEFAAFIDTSHGCQSKLEADNERRRAENEHALNEHASNVIELQKLEAERDALLEVRLQESRALDAARADNERLRAELGTMAEANTRLRGELATAKDEELAARGRAEGYELEMRALREAAEAVHATHALTADKWLTPTMRQLRAVLAKVTPSAAPPFPNERNET